MHKPLARRLTLALTIILTLAVVTAPIHAQGDDELRERLRTVAAANRDIDHDSALFDYQYTVTSEIVYYAALQDIVFQGNLVMTTDITGTVVLADRNRDNRYGNFVISISEVSDLFDTETLTTTATVAVRLVDDVLYVAVTDFENNDEDLIVLPDGWLIIATDVSSTEDLDDEMEALFDETVLEDLDFDLFSTYEDDDDIIAANDDDFFASLVNLKSNTELRNGESVEVIRYNISQDRMDEVADNIDLDDSNPSDAVGIAFLENAVFAGEYVINADDTIVGFNNGWEANDVVFDVATLIDGATGTMTVDIVSLEIRDLVELNGDYPPAEAPTDAVPYP